MLKSKQKILNLEESCNRPAYFNLKPDELNWDNIPVILNYKTVDGSGQEIYWEWLPMLHKKDRKWHHPTSYFLIGSRHGNGEKWQQVEFSPFISKWQDIIAEIKRRREFKKYGNIPNDVLENFMVN